MKSTGIFGDTIKGWSELSFRSLFCLPTLFLPALLFSPSVRVSIVTDDTEAVASRSHCRWQIRKNRVCVFGGVRKGRIAYKRSQAISTERNPGLSEQIGKVTKCDNLVMSHSLRYTLFYLTSRSHVSEVAFKKKKKSCPFISVKVALTRSHKQERLSCLSHSRRIYAAGAPEELSVIWQHLQYFSPRGGVAIAKKRKEEVIEYERNWNGG